MEKETNKIVDKNCIGEPYDSEDLTKFFEGVDNIHFDTEKDAGDCTDSIKYIDLSKYNSNNLREIIITEGESASSKIINREDEKDSILKKIGNTVANVILIIFVLFVLWIILSVVDTNMHNISDFNYATWNIFNFLKYFR